MTPSPALLESMRPLRRCEYDRLVDLGVFGEERLELLSGVLVSMSPQGAEHANAAARLAKLLVLALGDRAEVRSHSPLSLSDDSEPEPDVAVVPPGDYTQSHPTTALLVVEVADSSLRRDRDLKAGVYAAASIPEYWLIDLVARRVELRRRPIDGNYLDVSRLSLDATLQPLELPGVAIPLSQVVGGQR